MYTMGKIFTILSSLYFKLDNMNELILDRRFMNANCLIKPSIGSHTSNYMHKCVLERRPMNMKNLRLLSSHSTSTVHTGEKPLLLKVKGNTVCSYSYLCEHERRCTEVKHFEYKNVVNHFISPVTFKDMKGLIPQKKS